MGAALRATCSLRRREPGLTEVLGKAAADNCAKMKKGELAAAAAKRMAGRGWLPPALVIAEPEPEAEDEPAPFDDGDRC